MRALFGVVLLALAGCETHPDVEFENGASPTPTIALNFVTPADGDVDVDRRAEILAVFSSAIDGDTINDSSFALSSGGGLIAGVSHVSESVVRFVPQNPFQALATYDLSIASSVGGVNGATLTSDISLAFVTRDFRWSTATPVEDIMGSALSPKLGVDSEGDILLLWNQVEGAARWCPEIG
jgi:hypothetical protein